MRTKLEVFVHTINKGPMSIISLCVVTLFQTQLHNSLTDTVLTLVFSDWLIGTKPSQHSAEVFKMRGI